MRSKEIEADYRYFREPDLLPIRIDEEWLAAIKSSLPELPLARRKRFSLDYGLPDYDAVILTEERSLSSYFEATVNLGGADPKTISNWVMNDVLRLIKETKVPAAGLQLIPKYLAEIIEMVESGTITRGTGKDLLIKVEDTGKPPMELVEFEGLGQVSDDETLKTLAMTIVAQNPKQVATYKAGKTTILGWFVGQLMRETKGRADAKLVQSIFQELLDNA
jgi:aspartyl-tRNA(Asn)/glutamyl-tRNA(Gln) amidotransferase subunit B